MLKPYRSDIAEIAVDGFGGMQKGASDAQALQRGDQLHANVGAFANAADDELSIRLLRRDNGIHCGNQSAAGLGVVLIQPSDKGQRRGLNHENLHGARERGGVLGWRLVG